jgi:hypothetical protein
VLGERIAEEMSPLIADGCLSNSDLSVLNRLLARFELRMDQLDPWVQETLHEARGRRDLLVRPLQAISIPNVQLQRNETAFGSGTADWMEVRSVRSRGESNSVLQPIVSGELIATDKRVLIIGDQGVSRSIAWSKVVRIDRSGLEDVTLVCGTARSPTIRVYKMVLPSLAGSFPILAKRLHEASIGLA